MTRSKRNQGILNEVPGRMFLAYGTNHTAAVFTSGIFSKGDPAQVGPCNHTAAVSTSGLPGRRDILVGHLAHQSKEVLLQLSQVQGQHRDMWYNHPRHTLQCHMFRTQFF